MKLIIVVASIILFLLSSCAPKSTVDNMPISNHQYVANVDMDGGISINVVRIKDTDYNVTCWVAVGWYKGGISCIPDKDIK